MNIIKCFDKSKAIYTDIFAKHCVIWACLYLKKKNFIAKNVEEHSIKFMKSKQFAAK